MATKSIQVFVLLVLLFSASVAVASDVPEAAAPGPDDYDDVPPEEVLECLKPLGEVNDCISDVFKSFMTPDQFGVSAECCGAVAKVFDGCRPKIIISKAEPEFVVRLRAFCNSLKA
ncbi:hypothetical protein QJS10_CPB21g01309 [Acorus calamus]|uniref:Prolamin-like domain-containing protein n=1 Tax=Acorus calamus TaxID=4465 RepID=A0AAV9C6T1_ACOCL|nr:hypothetical protein QJS10_CPB21g01309 [Acorus calamus]